MSGRDIRQRAFIFACRIVKLQRALYRDRAAQPILFQLVKAGTSIGANLEEAEAGQSKADFIAKCRVSLKEARETTYWLRILVEAEIINATRVRALIQEATEIVAILTTIVKRATSSRVTR